MRKPDRYAYLVEIDRDHVPGWNHQPEDMQWSLQKHLEATVGHYNPTVTIVTIHDPIHD